MSDPETPTVERFVPMGTPDRDDVEMTEYAQGKWVRYADYLTLHAQLTALQDAVKEIKRGDCWCEFGIGNPMYGGHTTACDRLRALVDPSPQEKT